MSSEPNNEVRTFRPGVRPNPKKDSGARRPRNRAGIVSVKEAPKAQPVCKECRIRPRKIGSSRCEKCVTEHLKKNETGSSPRNS